MDYINRALIACALLLFASSASAAVTYDSSQVLSCAGYASAADAFECSSRQYFGAQAYTVESLTYDSSQNPPMGVYRGRSYQNSNPTTAWNDTIIINGTCPEGSIWDSVTGTCKSSCTQGTSTGPAGYVDHGISPEVAGAQSGCYGGCKVLFMGSYPVARSLVGGKYHYFGKGDYEKTGGTCTESDSVGLPGSSVPPSTCGSGQVLGQFNGADMCLDGGTGAPTNPNTPAPTETATTNTNTTSNPDGSTTKTETTTNPDGSQVVVTTTTNPDGSSTKTTEEKPAPDEDPKKSFCEDNPEAQLCKTSDFGGGCGGFNCKGDAVQCAIAMEIHKRNCELYTPTALSDLGNQLASGTDPNASSHPAAAANRQVFDLSSSINTSKRYAGSCPADRSITVMGQAIAIPLSTLCPYLVMFGNVMIVLAMLGAARTVGVF